MGPFIQRHEENVTGVLSGFDRLVLRGTLRTLSYTAGMMNFLYEIGVLLKEFGGLRRAYHQAPASGLL